MKKATLLLALLILLTACQARATPTIQGVTPSPTATPSPTITPTPNATERYQGTLQANQTQNAGYMLTQEAKGTAAEIALATLRALPPTNTPTLTLTPTATPTKTPLPPPTPIPPLTEHTWSPETVLIRLETFGGDGGILYPLPHLILYGDGQLFVDLQTKQLDRKDTCALLNTVEQLGYLNYQPATYMQDKDGNDQEYLQFDGSDTTRITINSWAYKTGKYYGLSSFIYFDYYYPICLDCELAPTILPALLNTFEFLYSFQPDGMIAYEPEKIEVRVDVLGSTDNEPSWPLDYPRLTELYDPDSQEPTIFTGEIAKQIYDLVFGIGGERGTYYSEDGVAYSVYAHPVYPYPWNTEEKYPGIPDTLTCYPADGVFETP